ncbi:CRP-like cAMP-binding protein [Povalibacter uvarum]|uniref:CRP-like cAMP-binding protein n=1 Tax=Povalibacter uvarum TaxID=732238 RepID=A0A841HRR2_9GAMM|nr:Crp/Fnr family transcriptional regulator [Povalibacter uvarum]MBB6095586.1 CRP-like cAMP-binding protein [Povalibacter uvarum]
MSSVLDALAALEKRAGVSLPDIEVIERAIEPVELRPGEFAFRQGEPHPYVHIVHTGLLKQYFTDQDGSEWIKSFSAEQVPFACLEALSGLPALFTSEAIEASVTERVPFRQILALADRHAQWQKALGTAYALLARIKVRRERDLLMLTAEQLHARFVVESPALAERIPQKDLAGFIGVTPVGLNRIVKRYREKH